MRVCVGPLLPHIVARARPRRQRLGRRRDRPDADRHRRPGLLDPLVDGAGNRVTRSRPGTYTIEVKDIATRAQLPPDRARRAFDMIDDRRGDGTRHLDGHLPGGTLPLPVRPARTMMKGDFTVEPGAPLPAARRRPRRPRARRRRPRRLRRPRSKLAARSARARRSARQARRRKGRRAQGGRVVSITVADRSAKDNFHLNGPRREPRHLEGRPRRRHLAADAEARALPRTARTRPRRSRARSGST